MKIYTIISDINGVGKSSLTGVSLQRFFALLFLRKAIIKNRDVYALNGETLKTF